MAAAVCDTSGLDRCHFRKTAPNGWGDTFNAYAYSMAWFNNALYVGNSRGNLVMIHQNHPDWMRVWPVRIPQDFHDFDFRAEIWRYLPDKDLWERVLQSPRVKNRNGKLVPRDLGYRSMAVFAPYSDHAESLYVTTFAPASAELPPPILRLRKHSHFKALPHAMADPALNTYRILQVFRDRLYTSPTGRVGGEANSSKTAVVLETEDPAARPWQAVSELGFGDPGNQSFFEMASFNDHLYVGTLNPLTGFQIWKTPGKHKPYLWTRVISNGAYRGKLNELAISMCSFKGCLYVGTAIQNGGYDRAHHVGPAAPELIRIHPDDSWDLIVGTARSTPDGWKVPLSGRGPGFDNPFNGYFWRMAVHQDWLYLGTYKWTILLPYLKQQAWPAHLRWLVDRIGIDELACFAGGCELWRSADGVNWLPITRSGFENPYNYGVRTLQSTPVGLFLGTANPFGPDVAVRNQASHSQAEVWEYHRNDSGGLEVWLGAHTRPAEP
jgi:hypothetical protein